MNMKKKISLSVAAALCLAASAGQPMKFLSFNIWGDYFKNPVGEREAAIESTIRQYAPDVISLQEVTPNWWNGSLFKNLSADYGIVRGDEEEAMRRAGAKGPMKPRWINHEPLLYKKGRPTCGGAPRDAIRSAGRCTRGSRRSPRRCPCTRNAWRTR